MNSDSTHASGPAPALDLEPAARRITGLLGAIDDARLDGPTPCPDYAVRELLGHLTGLATAFRDAARKDLGPSTAVSPDTALPVLDDDWREVLPRRLEEVAAAWRSPDAWTGMTRAGGVELPGEVAGLVALDELVIHGWDLARATGQPYEAGEAELSSCAALLAPVDDDPDRGGIFGPPVPVPDEAPLLDRVIGLSGRRPGWRPGS
ncbi:MULTISPECIES: TIGR03086 family metal-binding protein [unclassified Streptomyces]|uniref:TIGR03086 family metal-binding protein n=1 Tax=unclassified Streptomyces TaxID=2593676 RepID=UPI000B85EF09|nr:MULTISPECIES: TIGR03086 family metal-binding protein [unclassified Streptomyces]MYR92908.1 TIGR03086 family protein [Streptomyces sp. SID4937]